MDITIYQTMLPHDDPDASLAFYRDTLGFEVRGTQARGVSTTARLPRSRGHLIRIQELR